MGGGGEGLPSQHAENQRKKNKKKTLIVFFIFWRSSDSSEATRTDRAGLLWMEARQGNLWASSQMPRDNQGTVETALVADVAVANKCAREAQVITGC